MFYTYILYSKSIDRYYIGHTSNIEDRVSRHNEGSTRFTSQTNDWQMIYSEEYETKGEAMKRENQISAIEEVAQKVLNVRSDFPNSSLADLYDPLTMPPALSKAHNELDKAVDLAYRPQPFTSEPKRLEFLFGLYEKYTESLFLTEKVKKVKKGSK
jgi:predicted GIY-YIG superfamily endonuclease